MGARAPDRGEDDADDVDVDVHHHHVRSVVDAQVLEIEDDQGDVEEDGEDEVEHRDPEQAPQAGHIRA